MSLSGILFLYWYDTSIDLIINSSSSFFNLLAKSMNSFDFRLLNKLDLIIDICLLDNLNFELEILLN